MNGASWISLALILAFAEPPTPALEAPIEARASRSSLELPVDEIVLENGMRFLLVHRPQASSVAAGWVARVGSGDERPGKTGLSHFLEHLLFKGTRTIGARRLDQELRLHDEIDQLVGDIAKIERQPSASERATRKLEMLRPRLESLQKLAREASFLGALSYQYSSAGATGLNANTIEDLTMFYVSVPVEKLELWFWLESDRLLEPVFREFHKEKRVIHEERGLRVGSTPTGRLDEEFRQRFWGALPYSWLPLGLAADLDRTTREDVTKFFRQNFAAGNLTAVLVGRFDRNAVEKLARRYFGRLPAGTPLDNRDPFPPVQPAEEPFVGRCNCAPTAQLRYPSVPFRHPDSYRLQVLAGVLNGRTGRLYRSLVLDQKLAYSASVLQHPLARAGSFLFVGEARDQIDPRELADAWQKEVLRLVRDGLPEHELDKVKSQITADAYRRLSDPDSLMRQLLIYDALGTWRHINDWPHQVLAVDSDQVIEAARRYLLEGSPVSAFYYRESAAQKESTP